MSILRKLVLRLPGRAASPPPSEAGPPREAAVAGEPAYQRFPNLPGSDPVLLARFGEVVSARLGKNPLAERLPAAGVDMYRVRGFAAPAECAALVDLIDRDARPSRLLTDGRNEMRTSCTCHLPADHPLVAEVEKRMAALLGLPLRYGETVQGQRYDAGQQFRLHNDYFAGGKHYSAAVAGEGGQRTWTAMVFLNQPGAGGCTRFPRAGVEVPPETGTLLTWNNNDREGLSNPWSHHEGTPVEAGRKFILTKWFRERDWRGSAASDALRV